MAKEKQKYKKVVKYNKKPKWDSVIGGFLFSVTSLTILVIYFSEFTPSTVLVILMTLMFVFGCRLIIKGIGRGKKTYYIKK